LGFLVVNDFFLMRRIVKGLLMQTGHVTGTIDEAEDGAVTQISEDCRRVAEPLAATRYRSFMRVPQ
jgi:hypothetical protein